MRPGKALAYVERLLPDLEANDLLEWRPRPAKSRARMRPSRRRWRRRSTGAGHVQENTPEDVAVKRAIFARLDRRRAARAILASSTSAILPSTFTEGLEGRARCLVVHPINPPYLIPAAEIVPAPWTDAGVVERTAALLRAAGHAPIVMKREIDGFVMNRLQGALLEEAFRLVAEGYASVEDVDVGIRDGLALRWSFMGPFETIDLNAPAGVRDYAERYQRIYSGIFLRRNGAPTGAGRCWTAIEAERRGACRPISSPSARHGATAG